MKKSIKEIQKELGLDKIEPIRTNEKGEPCTKEEQEFYEKELRRFYDQEE